MRLLPCVAAVVLAVASPAQERHVTARLDDGAVVSGRVVSMDDRWLKVVIDGRVRSIDVRKVHACEFGAPPAPAAPEDVDLPTLVPAAPAGEFAPATPGTPMAASEPSRPQPAPAGRRAGPAPAAAAAPTDLRQRTLWDARLEVVDVRYPWLQPNLPVQWASYGLLLWIACSFLVRASAAICGAEAAPLGRSAGIAAWYLVAAVLQVAYVPSEDFATTVVLLANPAIALFLLRRAFGLTRMGASMAFAVQLGFAVVAFGALELVTSALGAVTPR